MSGSPAPTSARSSRWGSTTSNRAAVTISIDRTPLRPVPRQRDVHDPPAVADRRGVRGLQPRAPPARRRWRRIQSGPGTGSYYLPVTRTSSPIDSDIVQDISTEPVRQSLAVDHRRARHRAGRPRLGPQRGDPPGQPGARRHRQGAARSSPRQNHAARPAGRPTPTRCWRRWPASADQISGFVTPGQHDLGRQRRAGAGRSRRRSSCSRPSCSQLRPLLADLGTLADQGTPLMNSARPERVGRWGSSSPTSRRSPPRRAPR